MKPAARFLLLFLLPLSLTASAQSRLPKDVARFVERRDLCEHFRSEDPYDAERRKFLQAGVAKYCKGTDARLAALRRKYEDNADVTARLRDYETRIESP